MPLIDRFALLFGRRLLRGDFVSDHEINGVVAFINADSQCILTVKNLIRLRTTILWGRISIEI